MKSIRPVGPYDSELESAAPLRVAAAERQNRCAGGGNARRSRLILVRHGPVQPDPNSPPGDWPLVERDACVVLGSLLPDLPVVCSDERKAVETAEALGRDFSIDGRLREVSKPWIQDSDEFRAATHRYLSGEGLRGWEPQSEAVARFAEVADGVVVSHGTVMSLFVASRAGIDPIGFWSGLTMPDAWVLVGSDVSRLDGYGVKKRGGSD